MTSSARLLFTADLVDRGCGPQSIAAMVADGRLLRVRRGVFVEGSAWAALRPESRTVVRADAWARAAGHAPVFSHTTAAAIHGLPVVGRDDLVHVTDDGSRRPPAPGVSRHRGTVPAKDTVRLHGMTCTSLERTVADVARTAPQATSIAIADAALRRVAYDTATRTYDPDRAAHVIGEIIEHTRDARYGRATARRVVGLADGRADGPGESVSRLHLFELGFAAPRLQVPVRRRDGGRYFVDFALDDAHAFGEFDGTAKYTDRAMLNGATTAQALLREKEREDWIRGTTNRKFARWGWTDIRDAATLGARLRRFSITPP